MYLLNPTSDQLSSWFHCHRRMADFLAYEFGIPVIHRRGNLFYFVHTQELCDALKKAPFWLKIIEKI